MGCLFLEKVPGKEQELLLPSLGWGGGWGWSVAEKVPGNRGG